METILLNTGAATQKASPSQSGPSSSTEGSGEFSPVMEEAIQSVEASNSSQSQSQEAPKDTPTSISTSTENPKGSDTKSTAILDESGNLLTSEQLSQQVTLFTVQQKVTAETPVSLTSQGLIGEEAVFSLKSPAPVLPPPLENSGQQLTSTNRAESILLQQIQQIIDQGKDNGTITISAQTDHRSLQKATTENLQGLTNPLLNEVKGNGYQANPIISATNTVSGEGSLLSITTANTNETAKVVIPGNLVDQNTAASQKNTKLESIHQNISEQYLNAKIGDSKSQEGKEFQQQNQDSKGSEQSAKNDITMPTPQNSDSTLSTTKPVESGFGQQLSLTQSNSTTPLGLEGKMSPGALLHVPEREILDNLIQRFNVNPRLQTSKLSMQLHPAELGSIKIDILVQGDSIKTNIVAQSQQVMDTLEKNLPRLREVLQAQGFTVDAFEITLEGDGGNQKGLFQEHFNSQQQESTSSSSSSNGSDSFDSLFDSESDADDTEENKTGVNLTA